MYAKAVEVGRRFNVPCTPRCSPVTHALDCPRVALANLGLALIDLAKRLA